MRVQFIRRSAFRTQASARNGRIGIAFDRDQLAIFVIDDLPTTYSAIRTNRRRRLRVVMFRLKVFRALGIRFWSGPICASFDLLDEWPAGEKICEHGLPLGKYATPV